ncbi:MAG: hypothetical protein ACLRZ7_00700 [Lachnospiraceae bacterium]
MIKYKVFSLVGIIMLLIALAFSIHTLHHPEQSLRVGTSVTYLIYAVYLMVNVSMFVLSAIKR